jgi:phage tail tape-measure protein
MLEADVERVNEAARQFNETLTPALTEALEEARARARERQSLAESLKPPKSYERWWGRP